MFGETTTALILYLAPVSAAHLAAYGFTTGVLEDILDEKASIVFSYMPARYRRLYAARVLRMVVVEAARSGQTTVAMPFPSMSNVVGYVNPAGDITDFYDDNTAVAVTAAYPTLSFTALAAGDRLVIDFDNVMSAFDVPTLAWATKVLAAIDLLGTISGDLETGELIPRVKNDAQRVFAWLEALNSSAPGDRLIVKELEQQFYDGSPTALTFANQAILGLMGGQDLVTS